MRNWRGSEVEKMENMLGKIMLLINVIHNENMSLLKMLLPREKSKEIVERYQKQFEDALKMNLSEEK